MNSTADTLHGCRNCCFILRGDFRQSTAAQQQRPHPCRRKGLAFAHYNQAAGVTNIQLIPSFDACLFADSFGYYGLPFN
ncbi:MAG: hypothetical protein WCJ07_05920 [Verrucomicrobiota bacterium]